MKRYIFLDIDGVLNSVRTVLVYEGYGHGWSEDAKFDPVAVGLLKKLVEDTGAKIIISSSWRITTSYDEFYKIFDTYQWDTREIIKGQTPRLNGPRGLEIKTWLDEFAPIGSKYVIIDDSTDMLHEQKENFVNTSAVDGLSFEDFFNARTILGTIYQDQGIEDPLGDLSLYV